MISPCRVINGVEVRAPKLKFNDLNNYPLSSKRYEIILSTNRYLNSINGSGFVDYPFSYRSYFSA